eukprot:1159513-Pelagomonas_calceolata.AAC.1
MQLAFSHPPHFLQPGGQGRWFGVDAKHPLLLQSTEQRTWVGPKAPPSTGLVRLGCFEVADACVRVKRRWWRRWWGAG